MPGAGELPDPYVANQDPARVDELLAGAKSHLAELQAKGFDQVDKLLAAARETLTHLEAIGTGAVDALLGKAEASATKLFGKAFLKVDTHLANAIAGAQSLGITPPEPQDVAVGLLAPPQETVTTTTLAGGTGDDGGGWTTTTTHGLQCPDDLSAGGLAGWAYQNHITKWADIVRCLQRGADGWYRTADGFVLSGEDHSCPPGYHLAYGGGAFTTPWPTCTKDDDSTTTTKDTERCTVGPSWTSLPINWKDGKSFNHNRVDGHEVFLVFDGSEPSGTYDEVQLRYVNMTTRTEETILVWVKADTKLVLYQGSLAYFDAELYDVPPLPCVTRFGRKTVTNTVNETTTTGAACALPIPMPCGPAGPLTVPATPALGDGECVDWNAVLDAFSKWDWEKTGLIGTTQPASNSGTLEAQIGKAIFGTSDPIFPTVVNKLRKWMTDVTHELSTKSGCPIPALVPVHVLNAILRFIDEWTKIVPDSVKATLTQAINNACPYLLPSQGEANGAWLGGAIDDDTWECWTKSLGNLVTPHASARYAARTRPNPAELSMLYRRGKLDDAQYAKRLREVGVLEDNEGQDIYDLTQFLPSPVDIVRFMVRDVGDPAMVEKFGLDAKFEDKTRGNIVNYAKAAGVDEEVLLDFWRAHWVIPSYTQLVDMMFRLRPGRVDAAVQVTEDDVRQALNHNDVLPFWVDRLMQLARPVLNRTDLLLAFTERTISDDDFVAGLQDLGYTPVNAQRFLATYRRQRKIRDARAAGLPTARRLVKQYADGLISADELRQVADQITMSRKQRKQLLDWADQSRAWTQRTCSVAGIKKQYAHGLIDEGDAAAELAELDIEADEIPEMIQCWGPARSAHEKLPSAAALCKWRAQGLIGAGEQRAALRELGYNRERADAIAASCDIDNADRMQRQAERLRAKAEAFKRKTPSKVKAKEAAEQAELNREAKADIGFTTHTRTRIQTTTLPGAAGDEAKTQTKEVETQSQELP